MTAPVAKILPQTGKRNRAMVMHGGRSHLTDRRFTVQFSDLHKWSENPKSDGPKRAETILVYSSCSDVDTRMEYLDPWVDHYEFTECSHFILINLVATFPDELPKPNKARWKTMCSGTQGRIPTFRERRLSKPYAPTTALGPSMRRNIISAFTVEFNTIPLFECHHLHNPGARVWILDLVRSLAKPVPRWKLARFSRSRQRHTQYSWG